MTVERIYIGGLDPPRLSGSDIVSRLKSLEIELNSIEDKGKCFIHVTATSSGDQSALSIISQKYNNVKWKGCRLSVEAAKPHLLQRLEMERQERADIESQIKKQGEATLLENPAKEEAEEQVQSRIPRRLRIRKKFGDEAVHVDTRPFSVENWKKFHDAKKKLLERANKHAQKALKIKEMKHTAYIHAPLEHRAVHIRFASSDSSNHPISSHAVPSSDEYEASVSDHEESSKDSLSSDEESDDESSVKEGKAAKNGPYDWSDDDSDSDSSSDDADGTDNVAPAAQGQAVVEETTEEPVQPAPKKGYEWSSESSSDESSVHITRTRTFQDVVVDDEFAAGLDDEKWNDSGEEDFVPASETNATDAAYQMDNDVSANLGVLTKLFPDMKDKSAAKPKEDVENSKQEESKPTAKPPMPFGIMPRYDPTAVTSQKYEVKEQESEDDSEEEEEEEVPMKGADDSDSEEESGSEDASGDDHHGDKEKGVGDTENKEKDKSHIYQEGKLENVFREARDAWQGQSSQVKEMKEESSTGAFSFGFDLGSPDPPKTETNSTGGFSFGFSFPPDEQSEGKQELKQQKKDSDEPDGTSDEQMDVAESNDPEPDSNIKRRKGLHFSQAELQSYEADFFALNNGEAIMGDVEGFRNHQGEREQWLRERQSLTLDWKRKRKLAMSRIQKRIRHK